MPIIATSGRYRVRAFLSPHSFSYLCGGARELRVAKVSWDSELRMVSGFLKEVKKQRLGLDSDISRLYRHVDACERVLALHQEKLKVKKQFPDSPWTIRNFREQLISTQLST